LQYLSAGADGPDLTLGEVTTEKWGNFREQRWDLRKIEMHGIRIPTGIEMIIFYS